VLPLSRAPGSSCNLRPHCQRAPPLGGPCSASDETVISGQTFLSRHIIVNHKPITPQTLPVQHPSSSHRCVTTLPVSSHVSCCHGSPRPFPESLSRTSPSHLTSADAPEWGKHWLGAVLSPHRPPPMATPPQCGSGILTCVSLPFVELLLTRREGERAVHRAVPPQLAARQPQSPKLAVLFSGRPSERGAES
jgi:hypothetical protein